MNVSQERVIAIEVRADADDRQNVILAPNRWGVSRQLFLLSHFAAQPQRRFF
jgi:hypothetical protein